MIELLGNKIILDDIYEIREYYTETGIVRALVSNECTQSLMYIDENKRQLLVLDYFNYYNIPLELNPNGSNYLMLGGGAITYPHYYLNKYKNKNIDVIEINENCIEYARKYFYLNDLNLNNEGKINIIIDDAIKYIAYCKKKYDYILIDLFNGKEAIKEIYNEENISNLKNILNKDGVIVINYIINTKKDKEILDNIIKITNNYKIIFDKKYFNDENKLGNVIIILSNSEITSCVKCL